MRSSPGDCQGRRKVNQPALNAKGRTAGLVQEVPCGAAAATPHSALCGGAPICPAAPTEPLRGWQEGQRVPLEGQSLCFGRRKAGGGDGAGAERRKGSGSASPWQRPSRSFQRPRQPLLPHSPSAASSLAVAPSSPWPPPSQLGTSPSLWATGAGRPLTAPAPPPPAAGSAWPRAGKAPRLPGPGPSALRPTAPPAWSVPFSSPASLTPPGPIRSRLNAWPAWSGQPCPAPRSSPAGCNAAPSGAEDWRSKREAIWERSRSLPFHYHKRARVADTRLDPNCASHRGAAGTWPLVSRGTPNKARLAHVGRADASCRPGQEDNGPSACCTSCCA